MEQGPARKPALPTVSIAAAAAAGVSLAVVAVPWLRMSVEAPSLRVALETGGSLLAVTTVGLLVRQCGLRSRADHLWLTAGLVILALTSLTVASLVVAGGLVARQGALRHGRQPRGHADARDRRVRARRRKLRVRPRRHPARRAAALGVAVFALASLLAGVGPALRAPNASWPTFHPEIGRVIVQVATGVALIAAAAGLTRRGEPLLRWVAVAVVLAGFAKLDYALFPPLGPDDVHLGDVLRVAAWGVLLIGVVGEMRSPLPPARRRPRSRASAAAWRASCTTASRRSWPSSAAAPPAWPSCPTASRSPRPPTARWRTRAARSRRSSRPPTSRCTWRWSASARAWRPSAALEVQVNVRVATDVRDEVRAELVRIISEAVRNAANHGGARHVRVDLAGAPLAVRIIDDGNGFRDGANSGLGVAGYGLIAMRERAEQVGGQFSLESVRGAGTLVQVVLP